MPGPGDSVGRMPTPMQLLDCLAAPIPPPRRHRHRYYGVLAPNSPLRAAVTSPARPAGEGNTPAAADSGVHAGPIAPLAAPTDEPLHRKVARYACAPLLARIHAVLPLVCP